MKLSDLPILRNPQTRVKLRWIKGFILRTLRGRFKGSEHIDCYQVKKHETFFGYYDISPLSANETMLLAHAVAGKAEKWRKGSVAKLGYFDLNNNNTFVEIATTQAWCWQMGARLQWLPSDPDRVIVFNHFDGNRYVTRLVDINTKAVIDDWPLPSYDLSKCGTFAVSLDFHRLGVLRPGYGYLVAGSGKVDIPAPENDGLWYMDTQTKQTRLLVSYAELASHAAVPEFKNATHYLNHVSISPDGEQIMFFHLWKSGSENNPLYSGRLMCIEPSGKGLKVVNDQMRPSHYCWVDNQTFLVTLIGSNGNGDQYRVYRQSQDAGILHSCLPTRDGHPTMHPSKNWLLTDSYPDKYGEQNLEVYDLQKGSRILHEKFPTSFAHQDECRCDLHPRWSPSGNAIVFDSTHQGARKIYKLEISK